MATLLALAVVVGCATKSGPDTSSTSTDDTARPASPSDTGAPTDTGGSALSDTASTLEPLPEGWELATGILWTGAEADLAGTALAVADLDEDGIDEILVGAPALEEVTDPHYGYGISGDGGQVFLLEAPARSGALAAEAIGVWNRDATNFFFGNKVVAVGDVTGDGPPDWVASGTGIHVFPGPMSGGTHSQEEAVAWSSMAGAAACGDVNRDGTADLCMAAGVYFGPVVGDLEFDVRWTLAQTTRGADLDGDGAPELLLGAQGEIFGEADGIFGVVHLVRDPPPGFHELEALSEANWIGAGGNLVTGGDVDGDGLNDFAAMDGATFDGKAVTRAFLVTNKDGGSMSDAHAKVAYDGACPLPGYQPALADFDADGALDLAVSTCDRVDIFVGPLAGTLTAADVERTWVGVRALDDDFGAALATGDIDADGRADLVIGAPRYDEAGEEYGGAVHLLFGAGL